MIFLKKSSRSIFYIVSIIYVFSIFNVGIMSDIEKTENLTINSGQDIGAPTGG